MSLTPRPRVEEFFLALLWIVGTGAWGYFGIVGYVQNITADPSLFNLTGFILSFFLISLTVFGLRFILNVLLRFWRKTPSWLDTLATLVLGITLITGCLFSLFSLVIAVIHLLTDNISNFVFGWSLAACLGILGLAFYQFLAALNTFEPFLGYQEGEASGKTQSKIPRFLIGLNKLQSRLHHKNFGALRSEEDVRGPLLLESDNKTYLTDEKNSSRPGLEKTLVAHGGFHTVMLGFTANGATLFAVSNGGTVHFQAGGRKGVMFPPEFKFWDLETGRIQTASLGASQTFLTNNYLTPPSLQNYRFLVPQGGAKFAWITPQLIMVGNWNNEQVQNLAVEEGLNLRGYGNFAPLAFNPEGSRLAWVTPEGKSRLWNLDTNQVLPLRSYPMAEISGSGDSETNIWGLIFSPDGTRIATLGDRGILLQNVYTGWRWFRPLEAGREMLSGFAFNSNGFEMAVGLRVRRDAIRTSTSGRRSNNGHASMVATNPSEIFSSQEVTAPTSTDDLIPIVRLWDLREDRYVDLLVGDSPVRELAYSPDNRLLAVVDEAGMLRMWEIAVEGSSNRAPRLLVQLDLGLSGRKVVVAFSPDIERMICATDNRIMSWSLSKLFQQAKVRP